MRIIKPFFVIEDEINGIDILKKIEKSGRTCYKSEEKITKDSAKEFIRKIIASGHESVIEHEKVTVRLICDRGVTHEIVRHRIASYSQESTRYCNYSKDKFRNEITVIEPFFWKTDINKEKYAVWKKSMEDAEKAYFKLLELGASPQEARSVLPNSLKTEIVITMNLREWRHFFKLRTSPAAHPQMRESTKPLLDEFKKRIPVIFDDIVYEEQKTKQIMGGGSSKTAPAAQTPRYMVCLVDFWYQCQHEHPLIALVASNAEFTLSDLEQGLPVRKQRYGQACAP